MRNTHTTLLAAALASGLGLMAAPAMANEIQGTWQRTDTNASRVRFSKCGDSSCGSIIWLKETSGAAKVGQRVFFDMKPNGDNRWVGKAFNPEDGKSYSGKVLINGKQMVTEGCALAGLVCRSVNWVRVD
ncbi:MAG: DUF2147 domain-containing protein [Beijerinckiaceae bacterium]|nr:DUF2147 domain-containing protein [Brevundimonas sp.]MCZ8302060.1 DUF2147 domain-containing protein [Beijerinckiaceae bacterium]